MSKDVAMTLGLVALGLVVGVWLLYLGARLAMAFAELVIGMNVILAVLMFILFPPLLIAFLAGYALIHYRPRSG